MVTKLFNSKLLWLDLSLFKLKNGDCIGGFTNAQWSSDDEYVADSGAMLFNLSRERCYQNLKEENAIYCRSDVGPCFTGYGYRAELLAYEPFNGENKCRSEANHSGYNIPLEGGKNMLTNEEDGEFTISELEVWGVTFV